MKFHLGDLLSVTDGRLLSPDHIEGVAKLLNHMTGDQLASSQLPLACDAMEPELLHQHPWLKDFGPPQGVDVPDLMAWLGWACTEQGEYHDVEPAPLAWGSHDQISDYRNQYRRVPVVGLVLPEEGS